MLDTLFSQIGATLWLGVCAFAIAKGDRPERLAAGALIIAWLASLAVYRDTGFGATAILVMLIEIALLGVFLTIGWKNDRAWPIWAAGFQSITVLVHVVTMIDLRIRTIAYLSAQTIGTYGVLICVAIGVFRVWRARTPRRTQADGTP